MGGYGQRKNTPLGGWEESTEVLRSGDVPYAATTRPYPGKPIPAYTVQLSHSDSDASDIQKLCIDMRTLVQTWMQWPEGFKFKREPTQYALFWAEYAKVTSH